MMLRLALLGTALALSPGAALAGGSYGERAAFQDRVGLPPEVAYRDPAFPPRTPEPVSTPPRSLNVPLYNVPPPRFSRF